MVAMDKTSLCMTGWLKTYEKLRVEGTSSGIAFWDVVILTTTDAAQQQVYELEIKSKLKKKELPSCAHYHVVYDPPGAKIGTGGSTMYTLSVLQDLEPEWQTQKILLMHAGGSSQRLPSASVLGKAFTAIPIGNSLYTMFDVKLAMCLPFANKLPPGVFICCPDTFETFNFGNSEDLSLKDKRGFVALAHPSPLRLGTGHGVYILSDINDEYDTEILPCTKVLQKPTESLMRDEGAVITSSHVPEYIRQCSPTHDWVFTDSNFFFDHSITDKLVQFYRENSPLRDEICAYGDFLQPLGAKADNVYINNFKNIVHVSTDLMSTRQKVFDLLKGSPLNIVTLKQSKFYHIGTMGEYLESFCSKFDLQEELGLSRFCRSAFVDSADKHVGGCIMQSLLCGSCHFDPLSIVEFCTFTGPVVIQDGCVVSNCVYDRAEPITIPTNTFLQTVPVFDEEYKSVRYVTLMFSVKDDMKAKALSLDAAGSISYLQRDITNFCQVYDISLEELFIQGSPISLWHARIFPLSESPQESLLLALHMLRALTSPHKRDKTDEELLSNSFARHLVDYESQRYRDGDAIDSNGFSHTNGHNSAVTTGNGLNSWSECHVSRPLYSFADIIKFKNAKLMIDGRTELAKRISLAQH